MRDKPYFVFDGQSLQVYPDLNYSRSGQKISNYFMENFPDHDYAIPAISGTPYDYRYSVRGSRWASVKNTFHERIIAIDAGGSNEVFAYETPEEIISEVAAYWLAMRSEFDLDVVICSTVPTFLNEDPEITVRQEYNAMILANPYLINADAVADIAGVPEAQDAEDTEWFSDGYHPTPALAKIWADLLFEAYLGV